MPPDFAGAASVLGIGASDLVPAIGKPHTVRAGGPHFVAFAAGLTLLLALRATGSH